MTLLSKFLDAGFTVSFYHYYVRVLMCRIWLTCLSYTPFKHKITKIIFFWTFFGLTISVYPHTGLSSYCFIKNVLQCWTINVDYSTRLLLVNSFSRFIPVLICNPCPLAINLLFQSGWGLLKKLINQTNRKAGFTQEIEEKKPTNQSGQPTRNGWSQ